MKTLTSFFAAIFIIISTAFAQRIPPNKPVIIKVTSTECNVCGLEAWDELKDAIEEILKLNPKPASGFGGPRVNSNQYVVPDFIINNRDNELELILNSKNAPDLRINDHYLDMLKTYKDNTKGRRAHKKEKEAVMFIKQKIDSAKWFSKIFKEMLLAFLLFSGSFLILSFI